MLKLDLKKPAYDFLIELQTKPFKQVMLNIIRLTKTPYPLVHEALFNTYNQFTYTKA